jgi:hypothetical protein
MYKLSPTHTTGEDIFNPADLYMAKESLSWKRFFHICTWRMIDGWGNA